MKPRTTDFFGSDVHILLSGIIIEPGEVLYCFIAYWPKTAEAILLILLPTTRFEKISLRLLKLCQPALCKLEWNCYVFRMVKWPEAVVRNSNHFFSKRVMIVPKGNTCFEIGWFVQV